MADRLFALSLDELLNVKVTTATKTETSIGATPALVEAITSLQLSAGYHMDNFT